MSGRMTDRDALRIGIRLRELRTEAKVSLSALAEAANVSMVHLAKIERGQAQIPLLTLKRLADALAVEPIALLVLEDESAQARMLEMLSVKIDGVR